MQWLERCRAIDVSTLQDKLRHNLPDWLAGALREQVPADQFWPLAEALNCSRRRWTCASTPSRPSARRCSASWPRPASRPLPTPYSPWGLRVQGKPALQKLGVFTRGEVEVQDEGSQLLALLTDAKRGEMVVDFCAGAGGKTLALGAAMRNTGRLYAYDTSGHRLDAMKPRLARSGLSNVHPVQLAHERDERIKRMAGKIDRVLIDAPCSGLGTLRRNPDLKWRQSPKAVQELQVKQRAILDSAARLLKPGGRLVYATCSLLRGRERGRGRCLRARSRRDAFVPLPVQRTAGAGASARPPPSWTAQGRLRLWPHRHGTDGFFAAVWQRR